MNIARPHQLPLPPGDVGLPFIGKPPRFLDLEYMMRQYHQYGPIFRSRLLGRELVFLMGPEANRFLLSGGMQYFSWRDGWPPTFKALLGDSLFVQDGEEHKQKRKLIMPAFHRQALHHYLDIMQTLALQYLHSWAQSGSLHWLEQNKQLTFEIASRLLTGSETGAQTAHLSRLFTQLTGGFIAIPSRAWPPYRRALAARDEILRFIADAIRQRQAHPTRDALGLLVATRDEHGDGLRLDELQAQALLLLFAGHETSASMLTSMVMLLAQHPDIWARARDEQIRIGWGQRLEIEHLKEMPFLEQILKEVERLCPPVPAGFRGVIETFEFNGYRVPKGWTALYPINVTHRDERLYRDPDRFDPDRFGPERKEGDLPYSLVGFGGGPRVCVGYAFAQQEMKIIAAHLVRDYAWELVEGQNLHLIYRPTLMPKDGLKARFWRR